MADRYTFSLTTFSPSGKLVQIEHALAAVNHGAAAVGIRARNGVVLATAKKPATSLVDDAALEKVARVTPQLGLVYAGMGPDARVLVAKARKEAQRYRQIYGEYPPASVLVKDIAAVMQEYTQSGGVRPFGVSLMLAGTDVIVDSASGEQQRRPALYQIDPSGAYFAWKATAIGHASIAARAFLEKRYDETLELDDAVHTAILALKDGFKGEMRAENVEIGIVGGPDAPGTAMAFGSQGLGAVDTDAGSTLWFKKLSTGEIKDFLANIA